MVGRREIILDGRQRAHMVRNLFSGIIVDKTVEGETTVSK